jgi:hypothetical protein
MHGIVKDIVNCILYLTAIGDKRLAITKDFVNCQFLFSRQLGFNPALPLFSTVFTTNR